MKLTTLSFEKKKEWVQLARSENVGPITFRNLISLFKTPKVAMEHIDDFARRGGKTRSISLYTEQEVENEMTKIDEIGGKILASCEPDYPDTLRKLEDAPPIITVLGDISLLRRSCVSIVGSRNASVNGKNLTRRLAFDLTKEDFVIVSGMARGIDTAAHEGALTQENGLGGTIAVLGTGVDVVYPSENQTLYQEIWQRGAVVSDFPLGTQPHPGHFPRRNRLISGLSLGTVVIEAQSKSGSLITAEYAKQQGREVFAVPGSPLDARSEGPNELLKKGARLVSSSRDILDVLKNKEYKEFKDAFQDEEQISLKADTDETEVEKIRHMILENLSPEKVCVDDLIREMKLPASIVNVALIELELAGRLERHPGNSVSLLAELP